MEMVKPSGITLDVISTENLAERIAGYESEAANSIILVKAPESAKKCFDAGLPLKELNVGGMGAKAGRKQIYRNVSASDSEIQTMMEMKAAGIDVYLQATPNDKKIEVKG